VEELTMARTGVRYEEVEKVANHLYQQGINPTIQRIRDQLGAGSNTTLARHLKTWREQYFSEASSRIPMTIPEELTASVDGFWAAAVARADENYQNYRAAMENER
jgi:SOS-response transcriptional repressor LexA